MNKQAGTPNVTNTSHNVTSQNFSFFAINGMMTCINAQPTTSLLLLLLLLLLFSQYSPTS